MSNEKDLARYFQAHKDDDGEWEENAEPASVKPETSVVYSLRIRPSELAELRRAAAQSSISLSELIRAAAIQHVRESEVSGIDIGAGLVKFTVSDRRSVGTRGTDSPTMPITGPVTA